jgi:hypothetical protein
VLGARLHFVTGRLIATAHIAVVSVAGHGGCGRRLHIRARRPDRQEAEREPKKRREYEAHGSHYAREPWFVTVTCRIDR